MPSRYDQAAEARRLRADGEGLSIAAIARELKLDAEVVAEMLTWLPCEECFRPCDRRTRLHGRGLRRCGRCYERVFRASVRLGPAAPGRGVMLVSPLAEEFKRRQCSASEVAVRMGWVDGRGWADTGRLRRTLGLRPDAEGHYRQRVDVETFTNVARAIDPDLVLEFDL